MTTAQERLRQDEILRLMSLPPDTRLSEDDADAYLSAITGVTATPAEEAADRLRVITDTTTVPEPPAETTTEETTEKPNFTLDGVFPIDGGDSS